MIIYCGKCIDIEREKEQTPERLQSLHSKLHHEAEKIRRWKTSTEMEIKEKVLLYNFIPSNGTILNIFNFCLCAYIFSFSDELLILFRRKEKSTKRPKRLMLKKNP